MIKGIGVDIVKIARLENKNEKFIARILSDQEKQIYQNLHEHQKAPYLAKRFAGKEALCKALNCPNFCFSDYSILNHPDGSPYILELPNALISLSDETDNAIAFVIVKD